MKNIENKGRFTVINLLKIVGLIIVLLFLAGMCIGFFDIMQARQEIKDVKGITTALEEGVTEQAKNLIGNFVKKYPSTKNIIICDLQRKVIYKANEQIVGKNTTFDVMQDKQNPESFRMKNGYMRFMTIPKKIEPFSSWPQNSPGFDGNNQMGMRRDERMSWAPGQRIKDNQGQRLFINSFNVGSDGMKVFFISGHFKENKMIQILSVTHGILRILFMVFWVLLAVWVYKDSKARGLNQVLWGLITLFTGFAGAIIYLIFRHNINFCGICKAKVEESANYCQECGSVLKTKCSSCGSMMEFNWNHCTTCGTKKEE